MDESVAEGISTSLQTCPSDPRGLLSPGALPSFPSVPLHMNDLGLTPPPGSQQLQPSSTTCQGEELETYTDAETVNRTTDDTFPPDRRSIGYDDSTVDGFLDGFDCEAALHELHTALGPRKRVGEEAFLEELDFWNPPGKRRLVDSAHPSAMTPPRETPSLSSPDSLLRPDQIDSAPYTPAGTEPGQSPNSQFDLDALFEDPGFQIPLSIAADEIQFDQTELNNLYHENEFSLGNVEGEWTGAEESEIITPASLGPSGAELTKQRFSLDSQDIVSNAICESLHIRSTPQYTSPYPVCGGRLGYLPSAPGIHVKCIEVVEDEVDSRMSDLKDKVQRLTYERNKYRTAWNQCTTLDAATGKSKEQLLREENIRLRRGAVHQQSKIEQHKGEAAEWRRKLNDLSIVYNNLLYEINVQRQMPTVAPIPQGYRPQPPAFGVPPAHSPVSSQTPSHNPVAASISNSHPPPPKTTTPSAPALSQNPPATGPIMIDLTDDSSETAPEASPAAPRGEAMIQSLRNKKYGWLQSSERAGSDSKVVSAPQSPRHRQEHDVPERSRSHPASGPRDPADEAIVRAMEAELAGAL
ncbi:hypothetical protein FE257_012062 [Aspergillus nanangensis]|uniref:Uncharacterized protein n=1 Tax=Aspergillus nanangensis TaxID=2582783 RepID=A0AAD4CIB6_ASPNN|nr:hypothetical protein FE257_012062 [Aspergillus nanangensis]